MSEPSAYPAVEALAAGARAAVAAGPGPGADAALPPGGDPGAAGATGIAAEGRVSATVGADGRLRGLVVEPELLRQPLEDVAAAARAAINEALAAASSEPDYTPVVDLIRDVQSQVRRDLGRVSSAMAEVAEHVRHTQGRAGRWA